MNVSYERIMIGTDGSGASIEALAHAVSLAKAFNAELRVVHIFDPQSSDHFVLDDKGDSKRSANELKADAQEVLDGAVARIPDITSLDIEVTLEEGDPADKLLELSETHNADLLIIGSKGVSGFKRFMLGSVSYAVTRRATRPVLVIHS